MKFDIYIDGVRLENWSAAAITLDAQTGANASFTISSAGRGPWLTNLSKVRITGRTVQTETASWGFEAATDCDAWRLDNLADAGIDYTESAFGSGSWALAWQDLGAAGRVLQMPAAPQNMNGLVFWGWWNVEYLSELRPPAYVEAYAYDAVGEWVAPRVRIPEQLAGWRAVGFRIAPTYANERIPSAVTEWGFRLTAEEPAAGVAAVLHLDSVNLCGRAYRQTLQLPPFDASAPAGALQPYPEHTCANWDEFHWADELHVAPSDAGWCAESAVWEEFLWASEKQLTKDDKQWN